MQYQNLIRKAWRLTQEHHYLNKWGILVSIFTLLVGILRLRYFFTNPAITVTTIWEYVSTHFDNPITMMAIVETTWLSIYLFAFLVHNLSDGALISAIAKIESQKVKLSFGKSFSLGLNAFLRITEYNAVTSFFQIGHLVVYVLFLRFYLLIYMDGWDFVAENYYWLIPVGIFISILSLFMTYGEYDLVIKKNGVFASIRNSMTLVTFHLGETLLIMLLVLLITVRALVNILLVFLVPAGVASIVSYLSIVISPIIAGGIGATVGLVVFWFAIKIAGALHVFTTAVWVLTYLELDSRQEHKILLGEKDNDEE